MLADVGHKLFGVALVLAVIGVGWGRPVAIAKPGVVAFERGGDIFVANVDGSGERNLTRVGIGPASYPDVSPDGTTIVFAERIGALLDYRTVVMNVDGTGLRRIGNLSHGFSPRWSPDGSLIAYGGPPDIDVVAPDGSGLRTVATDAAEFPDEVSMFRGDVKHPGFPRGSVMWLRGLVCCLFCSSSARTRRAASPTSTVRRK